MSDDPAARLDRARLRRRFDAAAPHYAEAAVVQREVGRRLLERFDLLKIQPQRILDLGCGPGTHTALLAGRFPGAQVYALDHAPAMVRAAAPAITGGWLERWWPRRATTLARPQGIVGDLMQLPLAGGQIDVLWSNFAAQWSDDLPATLAEWARVLRVDGVLMFTLPGPDTLIELRRALRAVGEAPERRLHRLTDLHDVGDMLLQAGFGDPVMDMEIITLEYASAAALWRDLRAQAAQSALQQRPRGLLTPRRLRAIEAALRAQQPDPQAPLRISVEVIYGHAWKLAPRRTAEGHGIVRVGEIGRVQH